MKLTVKLIFLVIILSEIFESSLATRVRKRKVRIRKPRKGLFQVLNQPKGGKTITKPIPSNLLPKSGANGGPNQSNWWKPPVDAKNNLDSQPRDDIPDPGDAQSSSRKDENRQSPFLDFPSAEYEPLLDFPDPLDGVNKVIARSYNEACDEIKNTQSKKTAPRPKRKPEIVHQIETQNRRLAQSMIRTFIENENQTEQNPIYGFKLLNQSGEIFSKLCPEPFVPKQFVNNVINIFSKLHFLVSANRTEFLSTETFEWVSENLERCRKSTIQYELIGNGCGKIEKWKEDKAANRSKIAWFCTDWKDDFNLRTYDPLIDFIWHIFKAAHGFCFRYFSDSFEKFHGYSVAILDLIHTSVRLRWNYNVAEGKYWDLLLGPNFRHYMRNFEKCATAPNIVYFDKVKLPRFMYGGSVRYDRSEKSQL